jgi:hypothetical protein
MMIYFFVAVAVILVVMMIIYLRKGEEMEGSPFFAREDGKMRYAYPVTRVIELCGIRQVMSPYPLKNPPFPTLQVSIKSRWNCQRLVFLRRDSRRICSIL